MIGELGLAA